MDNNERTFAAIEKLQEMMSNLRSDLKVITARQEELLHKYKHESKRSDEFAERLRSVESTQALHKGYFVMLGTSMLLCVGSLFQLFVNRL